MTTDLQVSETRTASGNEKADDEKKAPKVSRKVVARRLPPTLTEEYFVEIVGPLAEHTYFEFVTGDMALEPYAFARAYINFKNDEDVFNFRNRFDGYVFVDARGNDYHAVVEFATYQKVPLAKSKEKKDTKVGTIFEDPEYLQFVESLDHPNNSGLANPEAFLEELDVKEKEAKNKELSTPLLEFVRDKRAEQERRVQERHEARKKRDDERRRAREENRKRKKASAEKAFQELDSKKYTSTGSAPSDKRGSNDEAEDAESVDSKSKLRNTRRERKAEQMEKDGEKPKKKDGDKDGKRDRNRDKGTKKDGEKMGKEVVSPPLENERINKPKSKEESGSESQSIVGTSNSTAGKTKEERESERREKRLKNKERPAMEIYRPGMGKFSAQTLKVNDARSESPTNEKDVSDESDELKSNRLHKDGGSHGKKNEKPVSKGGRSDPHGGQKEGHRRQREDDRPKQVVDEKFSKKKPLKVEDERASDPGGRGSSSGGRFSNRSGLRDEKPAEQKQLNPSQADGDTVVPTVLNNADPLKKSGKSYLTKRRERQQERDENSTKSEEQQPASEP